MFFCTEPEKRSANERPGGKVKRTLRFCLHRGLGASFAFVGGNDGKESTSFPHHHPKFDVNEGCLAVSAGFMETFVRRYLESAS